MEKERTDKMIAESAKTIFSYCRARTRSKEEAEDLSQDIILELLGAKGSFCNDKAFYGFMWAVADNVYKDWCKKRAKVNLLVLDERIPDKSVPIIEVLEKEADFRLLYRELMLLGEQHRKVTVMYYFDGLKVSQISKSLGISESMVKFLLFKSRKILKEGMNMERTELSFNPRRMTLGISSKDSWPRWVDPTYFERNVLAQNILLACYNEPCTAEEISLQLGIAVPYLEKDLMELCEWSGVLTKKNNRYETDIVIFTKDFSAEATAKTLEYQQKIADTITSFLDERLGDFKAIGFYTGGSDDSLLRWRIMHFILDQAIKRKYGKDCNIEYSTKHDGHTVFLWGMEESKPKYGCIAAGYSNDSGDQIQFLEFQSGSWFEKTFGFGYFWKRTDRVNLILELAKGKMNGFSESEMLEVAELIKHGFLKKNGDVIKLCIPIYTAHQFEKAAALTNNVTDEISEITREMIKISTDILVQHSPASKKKEVESIGWLKIRDLAMDRPVEIMLGSGALRRTADNERPTSYVVLK